jgi:hypothetical protein
MPTTIETARTAAATARELYLQAVGAEQTTYRVAFCGPEETPATEAAWREASHEAGRTKARWTEACLALWIMLGEEPVP